MLRSINYGFAVSNAAINGLSAAFGILLPLAFLHSEMVLRNEGLLILGGITVMLIGVSLCGWAGFRREEEVKQQGRAAGFAREESAMTQVGATRAQYAIYIAITLTAGVMASFLNIALAYGADITRAAIAQGGRASWAPFATWPIAMSGAAILNIGYTLYLITKNRGWGLFKRGLQEVFNPILAACLWMGGVAIYSSGTTYLGLLGVSIGYALYSILIIFCGQSAAIITGEWQGVRPSIYRPFVAGIAMLSVAFAAIGAANYLQK